MDDLQSHPSCTAEREACSHSHHPDTAAAERVVGEPGGSSQNRSSTRCIDRPPGRRVARAEVGRYRFREPRTSPDPRCRQTEIERCKTEASRKPVPIDAAVAEILWEWRLRCAYNQPKDWVFASPARRGKQPYWPSSIYRVYLKPVLENILKIKEPVGWHTLRHSLGTLMKANGEDVKTIQETLRHANFKVTMDVYTQGITAIRRSAHSKVVRQIMGIEEGKDE